MKNVVVTGAARGIGLHLVRLLLKQGCCVVATVRSLESAKAILSLESQESRLRVIEMDLAVEAEILKCVEKILSHFCSVDFIINNAGYILFGPVESASFEDVTKSFQVNVIGPTVFTSKLLPRMRKDQKGAVFFMGSTSGLEVHPMYGWYSAAKHALEAIAKSLYVNLKRYGIHVVNITNSATKTEILSKGCEFGQASGEDNNYSKYAENAYLFLKGVVDNGSDPEKVAEEIVRLISNPDPEYRFFPSQTALDMGMALVDIEAEKRKMADLYEHEGHWYESNDAKC